MKKRKEATTLLRNKENRHMPVFLDYRDMWTTRARLFVYLGIIATT